MWRKFQFVELTEVIRQRGDSPFIDLLNRVRIGEITNDDEKILKSRFISTDNVDFPHDALHLFAENAPSKLHNDTRLENNENHLFLIAAIDELPKEKIAPNALQRALNKSQTETGGLARILDIKVGARVMLTSNIDIEDRLINGQLGTVAQISTENGNVTTIYVLFDDADAGQKRKRNNCPSVTIRKTETKIKVFPRLAFPVIRRTQFPLMLAWACTVHKVQSQSHKKAVMSFDLVKQRSFNPGQMYVALSRVTSLNGLYLLGNLNKKAIKVDHTVTEEYQQLKENYQLKPLELISSNLDKFVITVFNTRSLKKHASDIASTRSLMESDLLCITETNHLGYKLP